MIFCELAGNLDYTLPDLKRDGLKGEWVHRRRIGTINELMCFSRE